MTSTTTTSTTWNIDYKFDDRNRKEYFIQVFTPTRHQIEGRTFKGPNEARRIALEAGLQPEGEV